MQTGACSTASGSGRSPPAEEMGDPLGQRLEAARRRSAITAGMRRRSLREGAALLHCRLDGLKGVNFCSNDYLDLGSHPAVTRAMKLALDHYGGGSGASQLVCGYLPVHRELERLLADWLGREAVLLFASAYQANLGMVPALVGRGDVVLGDRLNHASLVDAARLSGARYLRYRHADAAHLEQRLERTRGELKLVLTDGLFSMDGDVAPLRELAAVCRERQAVLAVDDAHGLGILGPEGAGTVSAAGLDGSSVPVLTGGFGKALGGSGGFVAGSRELIDHLLQRARTAIYSTAPSPVTAAGVAAAIGVVREEPWRRQRLQENIDCFRRAAAAAGLELPPSASPIQPVILGDARRCLDIARRLRERGQLVTAIRPPTVPPGTARLRITLSSGHRREEIEALVEALVEETGQLRAGCRGTGE